MYRTYDIRAMQELLPRSSCRRAAKRCAEEQISALHVGLRPTRMWEVRKMQGAIFCHATDNLEYRVSFSCVSAICGKKKASISVNKKHQELS